MDYDTEMTKQEREAVRLKLDMRSVMDSPTGRRVLRRILKQCGEGQISFTPGDPYFTSFREGQRNIALWLRTQLELNPEHYLTFLTELQDVRDHSSNDFTDSTGITSDGTAFGVDNFTDDNGDTYLY